MRITPASGEPTAWLRFALDAGTSKCVLFESAAESLARVANWRPALRGLVVPTLLGQSAARLVRAARVEVRGDELIPATAAAPQVDVVVLDTPLAGELSRAAGEPVHGLLGYSFLKRFRIVCDYPHQVLWLDPVPSYREDRPYEHSHVGAQIERQNGAVRIVGIAEDSPAARAGIRAGDQITAIDGRRATELSVLELSRLMEGRPGSPILLSLRRAERDTTFRLRRQRLL